MRKGWGRWTGMGLLLLALGCAANVVVLSPGQTPMPPDQPKEEGRAAWSLYVASARDVRPAEKASQLLGTLYTRFEKQAQPAYLDQEPAVYVGEQLSRFLLHRGLEASGERAARMLLGVELEQFSFEETPGVMFDELVVRVGYTVSLAQPGGAELGRVRLGGSKQVSAPGNTGKQVEEAIRELLADTFREFARSDEFTRALAGLR